MKKSLLALAALGAFAGVAHAQSSVTLYGIIDAGLDYVNNAQVTGGSKIALTSGIEQGSRWGLKGSEDLGGGLKTIFQLENGFNVMTGKLGQNQNGASPSSSMFGRQAYVGLSGNSWGTVTVGRQYDSIDDYVQPATMNGNYGAYFSHAGDIDNTDNAYRVNNSIKYASPSFNGLTFGGMYAFGGAAGQFGKNSMFGIGAAYSNGPIYAAAAYEYNRNPSTQFADGNWANTGLTTSTATLANLTQNGAFGYVGTPQSSQITGIGGTYSFGPAKVGLNYTNTVYASAFSGAGTTVFNDYELWGQYAVTPATTLIAGYTYTLGSAGWAPNGYTNPKWNQFNFEADYALSKRTDVYLMAVYVKTSGNVNASVYDGLAASPSSNDGQFLTRVGIRAKF